MHRIETIAGHVAFKAEKEETVAKCPFMQAKPVSAAAAEADSPFGSPGRYDLPDALEPPTVKDPKGEMAIHPVDFLIKNGREHPGCFRLERSEKQKFIVVSDASMYEDILTFHEYFGDPITPNMSVNKNVFGIPVEQLVKHESQAILDLRHKILKDCKPLTDEVGKILVRILDEEMGDSGEIDLRDFGTKIFWPMTEALFGEGASKKNAPYLKESFDTIDSNFGLALKGKTVPAVKENVEKAYTNFSKMLIDSKKPGGCPVGPIMKLYDSSTGAYDPSLTAKFSTAAWWGGQGNTLPSTVWTFGMLLNDPRTKALAYAEVDGPFKNQPNAEGKFDYDTIPYLTAALKEVLRLKTYSIAWRVVQKDCSLVSKAMGGKSFRFKKGELVGLHFAMRHLDDRIHDKPLEFRPERFLGTGVTLSPHMNGHEYAFAPFSAGYHKCAGFALAMLEIPLVCALLMRRYDLTVIDPMPDMNWREAFGVVGPDEKPCRIRFQKRANAPAKGVM